MSSRETADFKSQNGDFRYIQSVTKLAACVSAGYVNLH